MIFNCNLIIALLSIAFLYLVDGKLGNSVGSSSGGKTETINVAEVSRRPSLLHDQTRWVPAGQGGCAVNGIEGAYGPNLVHPVRSTQECMNKANDMGQKAATIYGAGFCMVHFSTLLECYQSPYRMKKGWIVDCNRLPHSAGNWTNDGMRGMECWLFEKLPPPTVSLDSA